MRWISWCPWFGQKPIPWWQVKRMKVSYLWRGGGPAGGPPRVFGGRRGEGGGRKTRPGGGGEWGVERERFMGSRRVKVEEQQIAPGVKIKMGRVSFKAGATDYDPKTGIAQKSYEVRINLPGHDPLVQTIKYNVVKPKATFSSVASSTLYMECGNIKDVSIQGLTEVSGLSLSCPSDQGKIMKLGTGKFALIPKRPQMDVTITMDGVAIGKEKFFAKPVPEPQAILKANGQPVDKVKGIPLGVTRVTYDLR